MLYFWIPKYSLIPNMMIDTSSWPCCSRRPLWSPGYSVLFIQSVLQGRVYHRFGIFLFQSDHVESFINKTKGLELLFKKVWEDKESKKDNKVALSSCYWGSAGSSWRASEKGRPAKKYPKRVGLPKNIQKGQVCQKISEKEGTTKKLSGRSNICQ